MGLGMVERAVKTRRHRPIFMVDLGVARDVEPEVKDLDDVISAGTSVRESVELIKVNGATACGVAIAIDRQEKGLGELSAVQEVVQQHQLPVCAIATLSDLLNYLQDKPELAQYLHAVQHYRQQYGVIPLN